MPTISLTLDAANAQRVTEAFGRYWQLKNADGSPRPATQAEIKDYLARQLKGVVRQMERAETVEVAEAVRIDVELT